jgi:hypothetical protein
MFLQFRGRVFSAADRAESVPVVIVNESFARKHFASEDPLGHRIRLGGANSTDPWRTIVGVIPDIFTGDTGNPRDAGLLLPLAQHRSSFLSIAIRAPNAMGLTPQVRAAVASLNADIPIYFVSSMSDAVQRNVWHPVQRPVHGVQRRRAAARVRRSHAVMAFSVSRRAAGGDPYRARRTPSARLRLVFDRDHSADVGMTLGRTRRWCRGAWRHPVRRTAARSATPRLSSPC